MALFIIIEFFFDEVKIEKWAPNAPYAALLGDIGNPNRGLYEKFIEEQVSELNAF